MRVIVLAAGYAVRLRPLTENTSKSLLEINGKKIIDRILEKVLSLDAARPVLVVTNARFYRQFKEWSKDSFCGKTALIINDGTITNETRLGAVKDMDLAITEGKIDDDLLVVAGDNLFDFDIRDFISFAKGHSDGVSIALYDIKDKKSASSFGVVEIDDRNKVVDFEEKPQSPKATLVSTGIYYFPKKRVSSISEYINKGGSLDAPGHYISWLSKNGNVYGFGFTEDWYDIGNIESYKKADKEYTEKER